VALDSCVLYPLPLRDTLLRVAAQNLYAVRWSSRILDEVARNLVEDRRATSEQAAGLIDAMRRAFRDAELSEAAIAKLESSMTNEPSDRHVLAAAAASDDVDAIITPSLRHFPGVACEPLGIRIVHPDEFLCEIYARAPAQLEDALGKQAADLSRPPLTVDDVLDRLSATVPDFVDRARAARHPAWARGSGMEA
jgi:hypothetical protein